VPWRVKVSAHIFVLVGSLGCIKPEIVGPESPRLIHFPAKRKFRECAMNFSRQLRKHLFPNKLLPKKPSAMAQGQQGTGFATGDRSQLTLQLPI
jgi:hypothetical protein